MTGQVEEEWLKLTESLPKAINEKWWSLILEKYNEQGRFAHTLDYLRWKFEELNNIRPYLANENAFILALFFQNYHYDARDSDVCAKNMETFKEFAKETNIANTALYETVKQLLEESSVYSTEEHRTEGAFGHEDIHYLLDLDLICLGRELGAYQKHAQDVAKEYNFLAPESYKKLRRRVLQSFLLIPNIFATKVFRDKYESQARANIELELQTLDS